MPRIGAFVQGGYGRAGLEHAGRNSFEPYYVAGVRLSWNLGEVVHAEERPEEDRGKPSPD